MIQKYRILENGMFGGIYTQEQIDDIPEAVNWMFTLIEPSFIYFPFWDGEKWVETGTQEELDLILIPQVESIKSMYDAQIDDIVKYHVNRFIIKGIAIPQNVIDAYDALVQDCNDEIKLFIPTATYSRNTAGLKK